jgi:hypothetical protein
VMYKYIFTFICRDKTITFAVIKPFYYAFHILVLSLCKASPALPSDG